MSDTTILTVCMTCRQADAETAEAATDADSIRPGALLHSALVDAGAPDGVEISGVECLSSCKNGCNITLSAPGKWSYVYGRLDPDQDVSDILAGAQAYAASADGLVPWRQRPTIFRKQCIARIPPIGKPSNIEDKS